MREAGYPQVVGSAWNGIVAPVGVPQEIITKLNGDIASVLTSSETRERFATMGMESGGGSPESFAKFLNAESQKWATVVKSAKITAE